MKQLYIIDYENAHWCGGQLHCVVRADSAEEAEMLAEAHMQETQYELFSDEITESIEEDNDLSNECMYTINYVEVLDETSEYWKFYQDPTQRANFYPEV